MLADVKSLDEFEEAEDIVVKSMGFGGTPNCSRNLALLFASLEKILSLNVTFLICGFQW